MNEGKKKGEIKVRVKPNDVNKNKIENKKISMS